MIQVYDFQIAWQGSRQLLEPLRLFLFMETCCLVSVCVCETLNCSWWAMSCRIGNPSAVIVTSPRTSGRWWGCHSFCRAWSSCLWEQVQHGMKWLHCHSHSLARDCYRLQAWLTFCINEEMDGRLVNIDKPFFYTTFHVRKDDSRFPLFAARCSLALFYVYPTFDCRSSFTAWAQVLLIRGCFI